MLSLKNWKKSLIVVLSVLLVAGALGELTRRVVLAQTVVGTKLHVDRVAVNFSNVGGPKRLASASVGVRDELGEIVDLRQVEPGRERVRQRRDARIDAVLETKNVGATQYQSMWLCSSTSSSQLLAGNVPQGLCTPFFCFYLLTAILFPPLPFPFQFDWISCLLS